MLLLQHKLKCKQKLQLKKQMLLYLLLMVEKVLLKKMSMQHVFYKNQENQLFQLLIKLMIINLEIIYMNFMHQVLVILFLFLVHMGLELEIYQIKLLINQIYKMKKLMKMKSVFQLLEDQMLVNHLLQMLFQGKNVLLFLILKEQHVMPLIRLLREMAASISLLIQQVFAARARFTRILSAIVSFVLLQQQSVPMSSLW